MKTALQIAQDRAEALEPIPPITDPMGRSWHQPDRRDILIDDTHAIMTRRTFDALHEYSATNPTGVYEGKMWKRHDGAFDAEFSTILKSSPPFAPTKRKKRKCTRNGSTPMPEPDSINRAVDLMMATD